MTTNGNEERPLPDGWKEVSLEDIALIERGITFPSSAKQKEPFEGSIVCLRTTNVQENVDWDDLLHIPATYVKKEEKLLRQNDILISMANSYELVGKVSFVDRVPVESSFGGFIAAIRTFSEVLPKYLFYHLRTRETQSLMRRNSSQTVNIANLSLGRLYPTPILVAPLSEQERIIAEIEKQFTRLEQAVASLRRVQEKLARYKASVLKAACEGRLVAQDENDEPASELLACILAERRAQWAAANPGKKYKEPTSIVDLSDLPELPEIPTNWIWTTVGQLTWRVKDGPHYSPQYVDSGIPFISGGNIRPEGVNFDDTKYITKELHEELSKRCKPEPGDILYTKGGTTGIARVNTYSHEFNVWVHVAVLKLSQPIYPFYIQHALNSPFCYTQSQKYTHGVGNQDLGLTRMVNIVLALPPLAEQKRIVAEVERRLSVIAATEQAVADNLGRAERLRQSILHRAFTGRLV